MFFLVRPAKKGFYILKELKEEEYAKDHLAHKTQSIYYLVFSLLIYIRGPVKLYLPKTGEGLDLARGSQFANTDLYYYLLFCPFL